MEELELKVNKELDKDEEECLAQESKQETDEKIEKSFKESTSILHNIKDLIEFDDGK